MGKESSIQLKTQPPASSYTQDGLNPEAHARAYENHLERQGISMDDVKGEFLVSAASRALCNEIFDARYESPQNTSFSNENFLSVWGRVHNRNKARVYRDIKPWIVPSAELLFFNGEKNLEHIVEEVAADWTKCSTLGGPRPRPDLAIGVSASAFTDEEITKLKTYTAPERGTMFTENMYFPFLLCEVKCGEQNINKANRQNAHSGSIAVNAIIRLHQAAGVQKASHLSGQILVFSISHDNEDVKIYGHYAVFEGEKISFYRHPVDSFTMNFHGGRDRQRDYNFTREVYRRFYPEHILRLRNALAELGIPRTLSMTPYIILEETELQELEPYAASSQVDLEFKKPNLPATETQNVEIVLRNQVAQQERLFKELMAQQEKNHKEQVKEMLKQIIDRR